jgi:hypothetical protein
MQFVYSLLGWSVFFLLRDNGIVDGKGLSVVLKAYAFNRHPISVACDLWDSGTTLHHSFEQAETHR